MRGVGPKRAERLASLGIRTFQDLIWHPPRDYEDRRVPRNIADLESGSKAVISGSIGAVEFRRTRSRVVGILEVYVQDETGMIRLVWFNAAPAWRKSFPEGSPITAYGDVKFYDGLQMVAPDYEVGASADSSEKFGRILPIYPLTEGISQRLMWHLARAALQESISDLAEILPAPLRRRKGLPGVSEALWQVHFPDDMAQRDAAWRRLTYEELFVFQTAMAIRRLQVGQTEGIAFKVGANVDRRIRRLFTFKFTEAQDTVIREVVGDMRSGRPMNRLLQGDVGCGKTVVAVYAMLAALAERSKGYQVCMMAPTEILAEQHFLTLQSLLEEARVRVLLLTSGAGKGTRKENLQRVARGEVDLVVGTHALIQSDVEFRNLALVVMDEQHRFGVRQRLALRQKGLAPDVLLMTATPIPRSLALAYFADMDISTIRRMPPGRKPVATQLLGPERWSSAFEAALEELRAGRLVFVVYPLVEENKQIDLTSAKEGYEELSRGVFKDFECCLLHGQMPPHRKRAAMESFREGRYRVMVATTVVEVGIDVPEATVMIVQHAERLGLAQLHQLRGRIGRGEQPGRCFLLAGPFTEEAPRRLHVLTETSDGFRIAEEDLRIRGPGQFFGTQQSGLPEFQYYDFSDTEILKEARDDAFALVSSDPGLQRPVYALLRKEVLQKYGPRFVFAEVG